MQWKHNLKLSLSMIALSWLVVGCATTAQMLPQYEAKFRAGDFKGAKEVSKSVSNDILWSLQEATALRMQKEYKASIQVFDSVDSAFKKYDEQLLLGSATQSVGAVLINDTIMDYEGMTYDKVMTNTYKAMNFMLLGDHANARVEFNRALERQRMAQEYFGKEIAIEEAKLAKEKAQNQQRNITVGQSKEADSIIAQNYKFLDAYEKYPNFNNPFVNYMAGLYFLKMKDYQKAVDLLKEAYGMTKNPLIEHDLAVCLSALSGKVDNKTYAHIIYESGYASKKKDWKIALPIPIRHNNHWQVYMPSLALPTLEPVLDEMPYISVVNGDFKSSTFKIASMDGVIASEFEKRFPAILTRAIMRTTTDLVLQKIAADQGNILAQVGVGLVGVLKNNADVRSWQSLPKNFSALKVPLSKGVLEIYDAHGRLLVSDSVDVSKNYIYVVRTYNTQGGVYYDKVAF